MTIPTPPFAFFLDNLLYVSLSVVFFGHQAEDACAAMDLYKAARSEWEKSLSAAGKMRARRAVVDQQDR